MILLARDFSRETRVLLGWNAFVVTFIGVVVLTYARATTADLRKRARRFGDGRTGLLGSIIASCFTSLVAVAFTLLAVERHTPGYEAQVNLCAGSVLSSWFLLQTMFALFYARRYFGPAEGRAAEDARGLHFSGHESPDFWDFIYFSFTLGICYQTSDVAIENRTLRHGALLQIILSFLFYTIIIGLVMNAIGTLL